MAVREGKVLRAVLTELAKEGFRYVPVGISARHVHLCLKDLEILFGKDSSLHPLRDLSQPGQFASLETVTLEGPGGKLENVRVLGPVRKTTQVELSLSDAVKLGISDLPVRMSGDLDNTCEIRIAGPHGTADLPSGAIAAARHIHMSREEAAAYGLKDGQAVSVKIGGSRPCILENIICRCGDGHALELHIDTDEANACCLKYSDIVELIIPGQTAKQNENAGKPDFAKISARAAARVMGSCAPDESDAHMVLELVTESDVNIALRNGLTCLYCSSNALITPAAQDACKAYSVEIVRAATVPGKQIKVPVNAQVFELITAQDLNEFIRDGRKELYCTGKALITPAAAERIAELGIRVVRV